MAETNATVKAIIFQLKINKNIVFILLEIKGAWHELLEYVSTSKETEVILKNILKTPMIL